MTEEELEARLAKVERRDLSIAKMTGEQLRRLDRLIDKTDKLGKRLDRHELVLAERRAGARTREAELVAQIQTLERALPSVPTALSPPSVPPPCATCDARWKHTDHALCWSCGKRVAVHPDLAAISNSTLCPGCRGRISLP